MLQAHDHSTRRVLTLFGARGYQQISRNGRVNYGQRVVARCGERLWNILENQRIVVSYLRSLAVHQFIGLAHGCPHRLGNRLVPEAHAKHR